MTNFKLILQMAANPISFIADSALISTDSEPNSISYDIVMFIELEAIVSDSLFEIQHVYLLLLSALFYLYYTTSLSLRVQL